MYESFNLEKFRWDCLQNKTKLKGEEFFYAVKTTGIFCRIGCPAKIPRRENIIFIASIQQAIKAGYRPCLRCKPDHINFTNNHLNLALEACRILNVSENVLSAKEISDQLSISLFHFHRIFKQEIGLTYKKYALVILENRMRYNLKLGVSITNAIYDTGYNSSNRFYENVDLKLGMKPKEFCNYGINTTIYFLVLKNNFRLFSLALTAKGICHFNFGNSEDELTQDIFNLFKKSKLIHRINNDIKQFENKITEVVAEIVGRKNLPLQVKSILFQKKIFDIAVELFLKQGKLYNCIE
ncbi:Ada metal-binding domain-containing protein [Pigmentibacter sp. JX0631]|uniref:bifunctional transcriptional activator/DNA repair enzyme AdaA n=1 Tax=Pigmentibacter sp. JX0631 TaxID=2976982 RepID=UPI0024698692|nr:Ada metal-binding domain-containing protein [Pigmentibacter sp. JX0631]WGL59807.1 Ada metal-binding domain-containing protein [Pigmentibacter sp. JX0631]